ncbi:serine protease [bacterium]|nr:serine protease [bacterium]
MKCRFTLLALLCFIHPTAEAAGPVVRLTMPQQGGSVAYGSAVLVGKGLAITAEHCRITPQSTVADPATVDSLYDPVKNGIDEAQLISIEGFHDAPLLAIGPTPSVGDSVTAIGYPDGVRTEYSGKVVANTLTHPVIVCDFLIDHGASGGGLFNTRGELIGIASAKDEELGQSHWIHTESICEAFAARPPHQRYERTARQVPTRVVVFTLPDGVCIPCDNLKRDIGAGKFPGYDFEYVTYDPDLEAWDKPELLAAMNAECNGVPADIGAPTIWVPGTGRFRQGYAGNRGLLGWIHQAFRFLATPIIGPPVNSIPSSSAIQGSVVNSSKVDVGTAVAAVPGQTQDVVDNAKEALRIAKELKDAGLIEKVKLLQQGKALAREAAQDIANLQDSVSVINQHRKQAIWEVVAGLITGIASGPLHAWRIRKQVA